MLVRKTLSFRGVMLFAGHHLWWLTAWMSIMTAVYHFTHWKWLAIPWLPLSVVGTAVAFYVGFKNNQSYGRLWEARKIWGGIVNSSRMWASMTTGFLGKENKQAANDLIYGYIAWIYMLRSQLLQPTGWEHVSLRHLFGSFNVKRRLNYGVGMYTEEEAAVNMKKYLQSFDTGKNHFSNQATYLLHQQTEKLAVLYKEGKLDVFKQLELQRVVNECYENQGKLERIKRFPLPRQYGSFSFLFVCIFIFMLPFGIVGEFGKLGDAWVWLAIPFGVIIGWIYVIMELIGDYSENPFEGLSYDIPMLSICRTIEIDLLHILGEEEAPKPIQPKREILM
jgi:putative membrane protein